MKPKLKLNKCSFYKNLHIGEASNRKAERLA